MLSQNTFTDEGYGYLISEFDGTDTEYHQYDGLGSTDALLDSDGDPTDRYQYRAFGLPAAHTGTSSSRFSYVGQQGYFHDNELDLYFLGMGGNGRPYDPATGRFQCKDRIKDDLNTYRYVRNNPVNAIDPSGQIPPQPAGMMDGGGECPGRVNKPPRHCKVKVGPGFNPSGFVPQTLEPTKQRFWFKMLATFVNEPETGADCSCCHLRMEIKWDKEFHKSKSGPPHSGFASPEDKPNRWYEDRNQEDYRYGHRDGKHTFPEEEIDEYYGVNGKRDQKNGCFYLGQDGTSQPLNIKGNMQFRLRVYDLCRMSKVVTSDIIKIKYR